MKRDEHNPINDADELPVDEVGDLGSFEREPEHGYPDAAEPELERVDLSVPDAELEAATADDEDRNG